MLYIIQVIPGVFKVKGPHRLDQGIKKEYVYAFSENGKIVPLGKVIILNDKVQKVETEKTNLN